MYGQVRKITIGDKVFDYAELDIEFEVKLKDDLNSDIATISIYNLSKTTLESLKKGDGVVVEAGYIDNSGIIYNGSVDDIRTELDGVDYKTTIIATPSNNLFTTILVNVQFNSGIRASEILKKLESNIPYKIKILDIPHDIIYKKGKALSTRLSNAIKILCKDIGAIGRFEKNTIIIKAPNKTYTNHIRLGSENGLISIKKTENKDKKQVYILESILNPQLILNQVVEVDSIEHKGKYQVKEIVYKAGDVNSFTASCVMEVVN